jgi:hypothetical protein
MFDHSVLRNPLSSDPLSLHPLASSMSDSNRTVASLLQPTYMTISLTQSFIQNPTCVFLPNLHQRPAQAVTDNNTTWVMSALTVLLLCIQTLLPEQTSRSRVNRSKSQSDIYSISEAESGTNLSAVSLGQSSEAMKTNKSEAQTKTTPLTLPSLFGLRRHNRTPGLKEQSRASTRAWNTAKIIYSQVQGGSQHTIYSSSMTEQEREQVQSSALMLADAEVSKLKEDHDRDASLLIAEGGSLSHMRSSIVIGWKSGWNEEHKSSSVQEKVDWYFDEAKRQLMGKREKSYEKVRLRRAIKC